ncbi:uncharacterized protein LOC141707030 [Apium graveolens]|uniref:uncharacterized protein LOC141707030 n=1 Tax=Apium graveolens TaxID=4045 RepID=UPI003D78F8A4
MGHEIERCYKLTNLIKEKICDGKLAHYVDNSQPRRALHRDPDRVIDVISGGYSAGGSSNNSKKLYARDVYRIDSKRPCRNPTQVISFSDNDYSNDIIEDHHDALVITTKIGTNIVRKILVDNGSSVDILYYNSYSSMDLGDRKLDKAKGNPLYGFTGNEVKLVGVIDLSVLFGSHPCQIWRIVKFHVVNSSFNAIIGRTAIGPLKAIISIAHQKTSRKSYFGNSIPKKRSS